MAITYPLPYVDFWEQLRWADRPVFVAQHNRKQSISGGGDIMSTIYGRPKWMINVNVSGGRHNRNLLQEADLMHVASRDGTILAYDLRRPFPENDPDGWKLNARDVTIKTKGSNNRSVSLQDVSPQFIVTKGDKMSVLYDTDKYFLFEAMETVQADGSGDTPEFEIWPYLPDALDVGDPVTMRKACGKFKLSAGGYRPGGIGFSFSLVSVP